MSEEKLGEMEPQAHEPNRALREVLGQNFSMRAQMTDDRIAACERLVEAATQDFFIDLAPDLAALEAIAGRPCGDADTPALETHAHNIRAMAKVLGFDLIAEACGYLIITFTETDFLAAKKQALLRQFVGALRIAFDRRITDDGGKTGQAMLDSLRLHFRRG